MRTPEDFQGSPPNISEDPLRTDELNELCEFCLIPETRGTELFRQMYGVDQVLSIPSLPPSYTAMQDIVPIAEGGSHVLLLPNKVGRGHYISLALEEQQEDLVQARDTVVLALQTAFPDLPVFAFEHGPGFIDDEAVACGGCHLDHAHGHLLVLPGNADFHSIQRGMELKLERGGWNNPQDTSISTQGVFADLFPITGVYPYLQLGMIYPDNFVESYTYIQRSPSENVESQLLRSVIADVVYGQKNPGYWHWKDITSGLSSPERTEKLRSDINLFRELIGF